MSDRPAGAIPIRERQTLAEHWESYARDVIPKQAGAVQREESRRAWYAGAVAMFGAVTDLDEDREPTMLDVAYIESLHQELRAFLRSL